MKLFNSLFSLILFSCVSCNQDFVCVDHVDPFIGTGGSGWSEGHLFPGATMPFGMVQLSPEVRDDSFTGYYRYDQKTIKGFSHTHLSGAGISESADVTIAPTVGEIRFVSGDPKKKNTGYRSSFSKETEKASAGYYTVFLEDYKIKAEMTATERTGMHRYTYPKSDESNLILDLRYGVNQDLVVDSWLKVLDEHHIGGFRRTSRWAPDQYTYFVAEFSKPLDKVAIVSDSVLTWGKKEAKGHNLQAVVRFSTEANEQVGVKVALSAVSMESAMENLKAENPGWDFDAVHKKARQAWNSELAIVEAESSVDSINTIFYTALYHSMLGPTIYSDVNGKYRGSDYKVHQFEKGRDYYTLFSLWDTYRAQHPLLTIIEPKRVSDIANTFMKMYDHSGLLPVWNVYSSETWCMMGYHAISVLADAYLKGINDFDAPKALEAGKTMANLSGFGSEYFSRLGYIPCNRSRWSVSKNLEYSYDDYCIAQLAKAIGAEEDYITYSKRAGFYQKNYQSGSRFFVGRRDDGNWRPYGDGYDFCEAGRWQYRFYVPHDVTRLIEMFGGDEAFVNDLDAVFNNKAYSHDNEPSHHMPFMYNYAGYAWKTQERVRDVLVNRYKLGPEGLCGNDDVGQMSAWYVLAAMGLYPICPGNPEYMLTSPLMDKVTLHLQGGKEFKITTENQSIENKYIQSVQLNGKDYPYTYLRHADIMAGGSLHFVLGDKPNKEWGKNSEYRPVSKIGISAVSMPNLVVNRDSVVVYKTVKLETETPGAQIYYTLDGTEPTIYSHLYTHPLRTAENIMIKAIAIKEGMEPSLVLEQFVDVKNHEYPKLKENAPVIESFHEGISEGGALSLIDGILGKIDPWGGSWVFVNNRDLDVTIDRGAVLPLHEISFNTFQSKVGYTAPRGVICYVSNDGSTFREVQQWDCKKPPLDFILDQKRIPYHMPLKEMVEARYVRVKILNYEKMKEWPYYGNQMLIDEIMFD